ncbi:hypothetical protein AVV36_gp201 [Pectobacterium bacteriophage PM2]|uniref:Uncharacterized protein n=1 Tax=Pectobacterium bacteriophage PM2 TaxID=1429794 RepID=A0A0A0PZP5_9CAUD|nr:hypothetical protein AVV36_gp201 [Pectobacterium bacteriophage PM2]AHY25209.1 hypothetical protein PM2_247 [Pectobacterium bacteriophage PM2]
MKLVLDESINPKFGTYHCKFNVGYYATEVWVSKSTQSFGIEQETNLSIECEKEVNNSDPDIVIFNKEELLILQKLVNQAVEILEGKDENTI